MLGKFPNYRNYYRTTFDTESVTPVIVYSGLVTYTHKSFIDYCKYIKNKFNREKIDIVISTWNYNENNSALAKLLSVLEQHSEFNVTCLQSTYDEKEFLEVLTVADEVHYRSQIILKRLIPFYIFLKALLHIEKNIPNAYVFKVRSRTKFKNLDKIDLISDLNTSLEHIVETYNPAVLSKVSQERILFSRFCSSDGIDEINMNSSASLFLDILGHSIEEFTFKIGTIFNSYRIKYPNMSILTILGNWIFPHSGSLLLGELAKLYTPNLVCFTPIYYLSYIELMPITDKEGKEIVNPAVFLDDEDKFMFYSSPKAPILYKHKEMIA